MAPLGFGGCGRSGPQQWPTTGRVTLQGQPVEGSIRFSNPKTGVDLVVRLDKDGKYAVVTSAGTGLPEGDYRVAVVPPKRHAPVGTFTMPPETKKSNIPPKYREPSTSGLTCSVKAETNVLDVDMQPGG